MSVNVLTRLFAKLLPSVAFSRLLADPWKDGRALSELRAGGLRILKGVDVGVPSSQPGLDALAHQVHESPEIVQDEEDPTCPFAKARKVCNGPRLSSVRQRVLTRLAAQGAA